MLYRLLATPHLPRLLQLDRAGLAAPPSIDG